MLILFISILHLNYLLKSYISSYDREIGNSTTDSFSIVRDPFKHLKAAADVWASYTTVIQWIPSVSCQTVYPLSLPKSGLPSEEHFVLVTACGRYLPIVKESISLWHYESVCSQPSIDTDALSVISISTAGSPLKLCWIVTHWTMWSIRPFWRFCSHSELNCDVKQSLFLY